MVDRLVNSEANARRIATVENCFGASGQPLAIQGRVLVGEGVLTKMCRKKAKPRQFFLFNDILVYGNILMDKKKYNKQHIIPLEEVKLENLEDDGFLKNGWLIRTPTKSFAVYAATATEKTEWMAHINKCVDDLIKKTGKKPSLEHAAVWIPDAEASICMHCRKTQFTVINRRHHCRKCGAVVCNPCSSRKFLLPAQSSKPLRVCLSCHDTLSNTSRYTPPHVPSKRREKPGDQDSSGEEDSEDEVDEGARGDMMKNLADLSIDEKPTFYGDTAEDEKGRREDYTSTESGTWDFSKTITDDCGTAYSSDSTATITDDCGIAYSSDSTATNSGAAYSSDSTATNSGTAGYSDTTAGYSDTTASYSGTTGYSGTTASYSGTTGGSDSGTTGCSDSGTTGCSDSGTTGCSDSGTAD